MENNNVVMSKQKEQKGTQKNWYQLIFTTSMLSEYHHAKRTPKCLTIPEIIRDENETIISGTELGCHPTSVLSMLNE